MVADIDLEKTGVKHGTFWNQHDIDLEKSGQKHCILWNLHIIRNDVGWPNKVTNMDLERARLNRCTVGNQNGI